MLLLNNLYDLHLLQKPTFVTDVTVNELGQFLQDCRDVPALDLLTGGDSMNITTAMVNNRKNRLCMFYTIITK